MSAFAALRDLESVSSLLNSAEISEDEGVIAYQLNSSDEDVGSEVEEQVEVKITKPIVMKLNETVTTNNNRRMGPYTFYSNFIPNEENLMVLDDNKLLIGLKQLEFILINGQAKLTIQRGAILLNNCHYLFAHPDKSYDIIASQSQALPVIAPTQVVDRSCGIVDQKTPENEHLFHSNYKSVVLLEGIWSGLQDIGGYYSPLKRFLYTKEEQDESSSCNTPVPMPIPTSLLEHSDYSLLKELPFEIVLENKGLMGLQIDRNWTNIINEIGSSTSSSSPSISMVIGNKNSGKSTFSKALLNNLVINNAGSTSISYLDLDPGQSEFSTPYCLSITSRNSPIFGLNINGESSSTEYYGFTTPQLNPKLYISIVRKLWNFYLAHHQPLGNHLVVNTPGWIKGLGKQLLEEITSFVKPENMIYLNGLGQIFEQDSSTLENLTFNKLHVATGMYQTSKYSPAQLRNFNKLAYFHKTGAKFNFSRHLLTSAPVRISYQTDPSQHSFQGVNGVSIINFDTYIQFNQEDLLLMIDTSIVGVYLIENETFHANMDKFQRLEQDSTLPLYINPSDLYRDIIDETPNSIFFGLCMIHSINKHRNYFNVYFPQNPRLMIDLQTKIRNEGYKLLFVKGEGEIPNSELLMPKLVQNQVGILKKLKKKNNTLQSQDQKLNKTIMPYVNFVNSGTKVGGVWKIRRNIMRRSQRQP